VKEFRFVINPDGSFSVPDIPSGTYTLNVRILRPPVENNRSDDLVATINKVVNIPEIPGGRSEVPFDLGELPLSMIK
jgi:hypothetical protein